MNLCKIFKHYFIVIKILLDNRNFQGEIFNERYLTKFFHQ